MAKYSYVCIHTKKGTLLPYLTGKVLCEQNINTRERMEAAHKHYSREREIELVAMFRWENGKIFCKIKCPVNPLPVKGEFEVPSIGLLCNFLKENGWSFKQEVYPRMFE